MRLTQRSDYAVRTLLFLSDRGEEGATSAEIAEAHNISAGHTSKVLSALCAHDFVEATRGRYGRNYLSCDASTLSVGHVVRALETFPIVECLNPEQNGCALSGSCLLTARIQAATEAFLKVLDEVMLSELSSRKSRKLVQLSV